MIHEPAQATTHTQHRKKNKRKHTRIQDNNKVNNYTKDICPNKDII